MAYLVYSIFNRIRYGKLDITNGTEAKGRDTMDSETSISSCHPADVPHKTGSHELVYF